MGLYGQTVRRHYQMTREELKKRLSLVEWRSPMYLPLEVSLKWCRLRTILYGY